MDLNRAYEFLSRDGKSAVKKIIIDELSSITSQLGYTLTEISKPPSKNEESSNPLPPKATEQKPKRLIGPFYANGRYLGKTITEICNKYGMRYNKFNYQYYTKGMTLDEIFPEPPIQKKTDNLKTLIRRVDQNGEPHIKLG